MNNTDIISLDPKAENARRLKLTKMLDACVFWYDRYGRDKFDPAFLKAMALKHKHGTRLTDGQFTAIERIYTKWVKF